jgi:hypothetical protein
MIGINRSVIIENNAGFTNAHQHKDYSAIAPGVMRIDVDPGDASCSVVWNTKIVVPSVVPKFSPITGLAYVYTFETAADGINDWYLTGLRYSDGEEAFRIHTGRGKDYNNNFSPITLGPDGSIYVGTTKGLLAIKNR